MTQFRYKKYRLIGVVLVLLSFGLGACDRLRTSCLKRIRTLFVTDGRIMN